MLIRSIMILVATAASCSAQVTGTLLRQWVDDTHTEARLVRVGDRVEPSEVNYAYDSWNPTTFGGRSERVGLQRVGSHEIGDDLNLTVGSSILSAMYTSVANMDLQNRWISQTRATYRWYNRDTGAPLGSFSFIQGYGFAGEPGTSYLVFEDDGFWSFLNIQLSQNIYFTQQETDVVGAGPEAIGRIITSPITLGSSSNFIRDFTDGVDIDLGPNQVNLCYAVRSTPIPAPAAAGVMAVSLVFSLRRRR